MQVVSAQIKILSLILLLTVACSRQGAFEVQQDLRTSLKTNESAKSLSEWKNSRYNNEAIFHRWKEADAKPEDVCKGFEDIDAKDAAQFEEEIKSAEFADLIAPCRQDLLAKIDQYWDKERSQMPFSLKASSSKPDFQFPDNVQTRDLSQGYKFVSGDLAKKEVILTFDDGPHPQYTDKVIEALNKVNAKGIFFTLGKNVKAHPEVLKRVAEGGHAIGSHSVDHKCLPAKNICAKNNGRMLSYSEAVGQIKGGHQAVFDLLGWVDPFFRFPYGESSAELSSFLRQHSVGEFYWSVDSEDWKNRTPSEMLSMTMAQIEKRGGGNVLFHDIQRKTAEALPELLKQLYYKGYSVVLLQSANPKDRTQSKLVE